LGTIGRSRPGGYPNAERFPRFPARVSGYASALVSPSPCFGHVSECLRRHRTEGGPLEQPPSVNPGVGYPVI